MNRGVLKYILVHSQNYAAMKRMRKNKEDLATDMNTSLKYIGAT